MPNLYNLSIDLSIYCSWIIPIVPAYNLRDSKDRFRASNNKELLNQPIIQLSKKVMNILVSKLLGDESLQKKIRNDQIVNLNQLLMLIFL